VSALLEVRDLNVTIGGVWPVRHLDLEIAEGEIHCVVGESGSGKSLTALSIMGLLPKGAKQRAGRLAFEDTDILAQSDESLRKLYGNRLAMIFQDPMTSLNPLFTVGFQLTETYMQHVERSRAKAERRALELLEKVGIRSPKERFGQYPHQLSGGMRQRVMIAMALMCAPKLIIADEPTTALDVTVQAQILDLLVAMTKEFGVGLLFITHDLSVVARIAHKVSVMYAGQIVETGRVEDVLRHPEHPYTSALLACVPMPGRIRRGEHLGSIPGVVPLLIGDLKGCHFRNRCAHAHDACVGHEIDLRRRPGERSVRCVLVDNVCAKVPS
jgi:peptide/nickel transport system ATP-binding protein